MRRRMKGYSLAELMTVVGLVGVLAAGATVGVMRHRSNAEDSRMQAEMVSIYRAMEAYRTVYGRYPISEAEMREFISVPRFGQRYEINPSP